MRVLIAVSLIVVVALTLTNPGPDEYDRFVDEVVTEILRTEAAGLPASDALAMFGGALASRLARQHTERENYVLFSIYRLDMSPLGLRDEEWRFLGIGTTFFEIGRPELDATD